MDGLNLPSIGQAGGCLHILHAVMCQLWNLSMLVSVLCK